MKPLHLSKIEYLTRSLASLERAFNPRLVGEPELNKSELVLTHIRRFLTPSGMSWEDHDSVQVHPDKVESVVNTYIKKVNKPS